MARALLGLLLFACVCLSAVGQHQQEEIPFRYSYLVDSAQTTGIEKIATSSFTPGEKEVINLGFCRYPCWLKIESLNGLPFSEAVLKIHYPILDSISVYQSAGNNTWSEILTGELVAEKKWIANDRTYSIPLLARDSSHTAQADACASPVFIRVKTEGSMMIPVTVEKISNDDYPVFTEKIYGAYFGAMLVMFLFNLIIFINLRDIRFLYYSVFIIFQSSIHVFFTGHHLLFFPANWMHCSNDLLLVLMYSSNISGLLLALKFLDLKEINVTFHRIILIQLFLTVLLIPIHLLASYRVVSTLLALMYLVSPVSILVGGVFSWRAGNAYARYFILSWIVFIIGVMLLSMRTFGVLEGKYPMEVIIQIGSVIDVILLGLALSERYNTLVKEKNKALKQSLESSEALTRIIGEQNQLLAEKIRERTIELEETKNKVEIQNIRLQEYNIDLEKKVDQRTEELSQLVKNLQHHVTNFEQYSYIVSHNLRSPIASMKGLLNIVQKDSLDEYNQKILEHISTSNNQLDLIVKDLNTILDIRNQKDNVYEFVNLNEILKEFQHQHDVLIEESNSTFHIHVEDAPEFYSVQLYIRSIFFNLLSNAIKYRSPDRDPVIKVHSEHQADKIFIRISDNGMGINLDKHGDKVFGLYQRFNVEKEGTGLGLFMVKTQVEILNGTISLESTVGEGTVFVIVLPKGQ